MLIKEMVKEVKKGNNIYKHDLYVHYLYLIPRLRQKYYDKLSYNEIINLYNTLLEQYYISDFPLGINVYLINQFDSYVKEKYRQPRELITEWIQKAKNGNKEYRDKLITHYSYIVEKCAKKYDYMEYNDLVQCGLVKLIEVIDHKILTGDGSLFSPKLIDSIDYYFSITLKNEVEEKTTEYEYEISEDNFNEKVFEIELIDAINSKNIKEKDKLYALKYFIEKLSINKIGDIHGCSKQAVSLRIQKVAKKLESDYRK